MEVLPAQWKNPVISKAGRILTRRLADRRELPEGKMQKFRIKYSREDSISDKSQTICTSINGYDIYFGI